MSQMKKVLIVDDSALMRRVLSDIINDDEQLVVEKTANNGLEALTQLQGDVVLTFFWSTLICRRWMVCSSLRN